MKTKDFTLSEHSRELSRQYLLRVSPKTATHQHPRTLGDKVSPKTVRGGKIVNPKLPGMATSPSDNVFAREKYDTLKHGERRQHVRDGADDHQQYKSLPAQPGVIYPRGHK